ncbi:MAG: daunorubicin/doxorubicin resistance ABC transporter ATP-binding protein DrrA, partial [Acidimicrobiia bacterium]|nr:daunorubicin/doxorubicin resistance ABC transporter ATP-binding protein DrrA [Acidimicrobiia bacterium]
TEILRQLAVGEIQREQEARRLTVPITGGAGTLTNGLRLLDGDGIELEDVMLRRPTLDDVFLTLTGHHAEEPQEAAS